MTHPFQEDLAVALENLRNEREKNAKLERENDDLRNELERSQHLLFLAEGPKADTAQKLVPVTVMVPEDQADESLLYTDNLFSPNSAPSPLTPDQE